MNKPDFTKQKAIISQFLTTFMDKQGNLKYMDTLTQVNNRNEKVIRIELDDFAEFDRGDEVISDIESNTLRYIKLFSDVVDEEMPVRDVTAESAKDTFDVITDWRNRMYTELEDANAIPDAERAIPKELQRRHELQFIPRSDVEKHIVRNIGAPDVGGLVTVEGIVTRITDVRPLMKVATYLCDVCGNEIYQVINKKRYMPIVECPSEQCQKNRNKRAVLPQSRGSKFAKFQEVCLQESPKEVPQGNVPRSIVIYCIGETTRQVACGDKVTISGIWLVIPHLGGFGRKKHTGLSSNTYLQCMDIVQHKKGYVITEQDSKLLEKVDRISRDPNIYDKLARSIAPEIYGLEDVKKALLLLLVSGVTRQQNDGMKIRGDINILLMGDPGVAKSQLLKHLTRIAPRCVYTTGKGSSGVGLTAAVMRDQLTHDVVLEAGALVLADMGICCIDEFDKMEETDRIAIHEVMEQQTISIAKAGITTTLNARTSILAAANPVFGRYDKRCTPEINIHLPAALLSRFDLVFVLVDEPDLDNDIALARHITHVHQHSKHPRLDFRPYKSDLLRAYISRARQHQPWVPKHLTDFIVECYVQMRQQSLDENGQYDSRRMVGTPRALLSILRLGQAIARLRFSDEVSQADITEAMRLMREAKQSALQDHETEQYEDTVSRIYKVIRDHVQSTRVDTVRINELKTMLTTRGFDNNQINDTLTTYEENDVWVISTDGETLILS